MRNFLAIFCSIILQFNIIFITQVEAEKILRPEVEKSYQLASSWFLNSINKSGTFYYLYDPQISLYPDGNNEIRQLMAARLLAEMAKEDSKLELKHQKNLDFLFKNWIKTKDDYQYILFQGKSKLGANAMALRTLVASPFLLKYSREAEMLKLGILRSFNANGSMKPFLIEPNYQYDSDYLLTFYTGEALVALIEYYQVTKDPVLLKQIIKSQDYYLDRYVVNLKDHYYPAYVPWHTISLNKLYKITKDKKYATAIFSLNDKLLEIQDRMTHLGRFFNPNTPQYGAPHASSDGVYTEGLVYAYEVAKELQDDYHLAIYEESLGLAFNHLFSLQYTQSNSRHLPEPERAMGSFRIFRSSPNAPFSERAGSFTRIDCGQHIIDAYRKYLSIN